MITGSYPHCMQQLYTFSFGPIFMQTASLQTPELNAWLVKQAQNSAVNSIHEILQVPEPAPDVSNDSINLSSLDIEKLFT